MSISEAKSLVNQTDLDLKIENTYIFGFSSKIPIDFKDSLANYCLITGFRDYYKPILIIIAPNLKESNFPLISLLNHTFAYTEIFEPCKKILHANSADLLNEIAEAFRCASSDSKPNFLYLSDSLQRFEFSGEFCGMMIEKLWDPDREDNLFNIETAADYALKFFAVEDILSGIKNDEIKAVFRDRLKATTSQKMKNESESASEQKKKDSTRHNTGLSADFLKKEIRIYHDVDSDPPGENKASDNLDVSPRLFISSSKNKSYFEIDRLIKCGTRKSFSEAWELLKKSNFRPVRLCKLLVKEWGLHFPIKLLENEVKISNSDVILPALQSQNPLALRYLNAVADKLFFNDNESCEIASFCEEEYYGYTNNGLRKEPDDKPDICNIWGRVIGKYWNKINTQNVCGIPSAIIAGDKEYIVNNISNLRSGLRFVPTNLQSKFCEAVISDSDFTGKLSHVLADYFQDLVLDRVDGKQPEMLYTYPITFLEKIFHLLDDLTEAEKERYRHLWTILIVHLWVQHRRLATPPLDKMRPKKEFRNLPFYGIEISLRSNPVYFPNYTFENEDFLDKIDFPDYSEPNITIEWEKRWTLRWRKCIESECKKIPTQQVTVPLNFAYTDYIIGKMVTSFNRLPDNGLFAEYRALLRSVRSNNIKNLCKGKLISETEKEKLNNLIASEEYAFALPYKKILVCFNEKKDEKTINDILAQIEAPFIRELFRQSLRWVLQHKDSVLWEGAPWTGMRFFTQSYPDRPSVWAKELLSLINEEWDTTTLLRISFSLGHIRESLGGLVPNALNTLAKTQQNKRISEIIKNQKDLFNRENYNRGTHRNQLERVSDCRKELIKAQNSLVTH